MGTQRVRSKMFFLSAIIIMAVCVLVGMSACKKDKPQTTTQTRVSIASINPSSGSFATVVIITGSNFSTNAADDYVKFNGVDAVVQQATATQLTVVVPKLAGTGLVTVQANGQSATGPTFNFIYTINVSSLAGNSADGFADGTGTAAKFYRPGGLAIDAQGNILVADKANNRIRKVTQAGVVTTLAGSATSGFADGIGGAAKFDNPYGIATDGQGNVYVADAQNNRIRKITPAGVVSTLAGTGTAGFADGDNSIAKFKIPLGVATDIQGNVYVADGQNNRIRKITASGVVSTIAGSGTAGFADGAGNTAQFNNPSGLVMDAQGYLYVADNYNHRIRKISPAGVVTTLAGNGTPGFAEGSGTAAQFNYTVGIAIDAKGNLYVTDYGNNRIRKINAAGVVSTLAGNGVEGFEDGPGNTAKFASPVGVATDAQGNIYVDDINNKIRMITVQ